eukprot:NODE_2591_length_1160_cov_26.576958_g2370_i0.p1 GENE.NODE_2591_length_1160_cov_26.576958_g2370_i0~~NODE_2591_length_1160_cov_26.576958_g2370_i0.p1  ORF type:complete len:290 (+),score=19.12 NODE_2591_length_1160_cov_26.576958_g2370_i0:109-978(+)
MFEEVERLHLVLELDSGGTLAERLGCGGPQSKFELRDARIIFSSLANAVFYLHDLNLIHGDLKPENILFEDSRLLRVKITPFGCTKTFLSTSLDSEFQYSPPESLLRVNRQSERVAAADMWALGVILFLIISGELPFGDYNDKESYLEHLRVADFSLTHPAWADAPTSVKDLVSGLLKPEPGHRMTAEQCCLNGWLVDGKTAPVDESPAGLWKRRPNTAGPWPLVAPPPDRISPPSRTVASSPKMERLQFGEPRRTRSYSLSGEGPHALAPVLFGRPVARATSAVALPP